MRVCVVPCVCAWGKGVTKKKGEKEGKVYLERSPQYGFEPATLFLWADCAKPQYYCQVLISINRWYITGRHIVWLARPFLVNAGGARGRDVPPAFTRGSLASQTRCHNLIFLCFSDILHY